MSLAAQLFGMTSFSFGLSKKEKVQVCAPTTEVARTSLRRRQSVHLSKPRPTLAQSGTEENFTQSNDDYFIKNRSMSMRRPKPKFTPSKPRNIMFVGEGYSGRTSLMDRVEQKFRLSQTEKECYHHEENGVSYSKLVSESQNLILLDMEEVTSYQNYLTPFYDNIDMFVVCFDLSDESAFDNVYTQWIKGIKENHPNASLIVVGCKSDIDYKPKRVVSVSPRGRKNIKIESLEANALELGASAYIECSSWMIINIGKVYEAVTGVSLPSKNSPDPIKRRPSQRVPQRIVGSIRTSFRKK